MVLRPRCYRRQTLGPCLITEYGTRDTDDDHHHDDGADDDDDDDDEDDEVVCTTVSMYASALRYMSVYACISKCMYASCAYAWRYVCMLVQTKAHATNWDMLTRENPFLAVAYFMPVHHRPIRLTDDFFVRK